MLFTQHGLASPGGTELFVSEAATALLRNGHETAVYAGEAGPLAEQLRMQGVHVVDDPRDCPWEPDIIHGQHRIHALKALFSFPRCPAVLHIHGLLPAIERPFAHPRIVRYLATSHRLVDRWSVALGVHHESFDVVLNHFDGSRFTKVRKPPVKPSSALLYSNNPLTPEQEKVLRDACRERGISLDIAGRASGRHENRPEDLLPKFDLVFAAGRSALEAAASGCAVIPVVRNMAEEMLSSENYERLRSQNMATRIAGHKELTQSWIVQQVDKWDPREISALASRVRDEATLEKTTRQLEKIYRQALQERPFSRRSPIEAELEAAARVLEKYASCQLEEQRHLIARLSNRIEDLQKSRSWRITAPMRAVGRLLILRGQK